MGLDGVRWQATTTPLYDQSGAASGLAAPAWDDRMAARSRRRQAHCLSGAQAAGRPGPGRLRVCGDPAGAPDAGAGGSVLGAARAHRRLEPGRGHATPWLGGPSLRSRDRCERPAFTGWPQHACAGIGGRSSAWRTSRPPGEPTRARCAQRAQTAHRGVRLSLPQGPYGDPVRGTWRERQANVRRPPGTKQGCATPNLCYPHSWKCKGRLPPFSGGCCVTHARRPLCPCLHTRSAHPCHADGRPARVCHQRHWTVTLAVAGIASGATAKDAAPMRALAPQGFRHAARARSVGLWRPSVRRVLGQQEGMCKELRPVRTTCTQCTGAAPRQALPRAGRRLDEGWRRGETHAITRRDDTHAPAYSTLYSRRVCASRRRDLRGCRHVYAIRPRGCRHSCGNRHAGRTR